MDEFDNDFNDYNEKDFKDDFGDESSYEFSPNNMDYNTFKIRNDTEALIFRLKLHIMNAYAINDTIKDPETGEIKTKLRIKRFKGTKPLANKQGISDIINMVENYVNGHTVQTNFLNKDDFNNDLRAICSDIVIAMVTNRKKWELSTDSLELLSGNIVNLVVLFLRRGIENKEREGYSEAHKETTHREIRPEDKVSSLQKLTNLFGGGRK